MTSLRARFALLVASAAILVILAAGGLFLALRAMEGTIERTLTAQHRLDLLAELSGRLTDYGLAAVDAVASPSGRQERIDAALAQVETALRAVDRTVGEGVAGETSMLGRTEFATRSRPLAMLRASLRLLDRQVRSSLDEPDAQLAGDRVRGALNAFAAVTGPALSFLVDAERRGIESASLDARTLSNRLRIAALVAAAAALTAALLMHRAITRPLFARLDAIQKAAAAVGRGELDVRLPLATRDELGLVVATFNRMAARLRRRERRIVADRAALEDTIARRTADLRAANERLEGIDRERRRFFTDVSHELRTPLTVILGECDVALRQPTQPEGWRGVLVTIRKRAQRLNRRVEDLLRIARSESGRIDLDLRPVSLVGVLTEAVEALSGRAERQGVALVLDPGPVDVEATADPDWLRQIVEGLIDNALRHAEGVRTVRVELGEHAGGARIVVADDGAGLPAGSEADLFERFARSSGRGHAPGFGIGLALARWVIEHHHGTIRIESPPGEAGARAIIDLPGEGWEAAA